MTRNNSTGMGHRPAMNIKSGSPDYERAYFVPEFDDPYPEPGWEKITRVEYCSILNLRREPAAVKIRDGEDADYVLGTDFWVRYWLDDETEPRIVRVPAGLATDLASVPSIARGIVNRTGPHLEASIVHDFLYLAWQDLPGRGPRDEDRDFADALFLKLMKESRVSPAQRFMIHRSVRAFGAGVYRERDENRYVRLPPLCPTTGQLVQPRCRPGGVGAPSGPPVA